VQSLRTGERKTLVRGGYYGRYVLSGHLLYVSKGALYAAPMDVKRMELTGPAVQVVDEVAGDSRYGFAPVDVALNGTLAYVREKGIVRQTLVWLDGTGRIKPLRAVARNYLTLAFAPDGKRLAVVMNVDGNFDVWVCEWKRDVMTRLTFASGVDYAPVWTPDGKHLVIASERHGGVPNLYWTRADGAGEAVRLTESKSRQNPMSFSPDGKRLAFQEESSQTQWDLWTLPLEEVESDHPKPGKPEPFLVTQYNEGHPMISPDGRWLAYGSDESGSDEVYVRRFPEAGGKLQISTSGGRCPVWSKKGQELFYGSDQGIVAVNYTTRGEGFVASKPRLWAEKKDLGSFDLSPDSQQFAVVQEVESKEKSPIHVTFLLNFFDELRRKVPAGRR
jgi:Tol biopolymer transport system component